MKDMDTIIFHGSDRVVKKPEFGLGKPYNDYGRGFYCTEHLDMAMEWAVGSNSDGFANEYLIDYDGLTIVDLDSSEFTTLHWLAVLLEHRWFDVRAPLAHEARNYLLENFAVDLSKADVVQGYRADDSYFMFAQDFIGGAISYRQLKLAMHLGDLGKQIMIKSERAFERLQFRQALDVPCSVWLPRRELRDRQARERYFNHERNARRPGDFFIASIIDEGMDANDDRLR